MTYHLDELVEQYFVLVDVSTETFLTPNGSLHGDPRKAMTFRTLSDAMNHRTVIKRLDLYVEIVRLTTQKVVEVVR